jgi:hypothetical protein
MSPSSREFAPDGPTPFTLGVPLPGRGVVASRAADEAVTWLQGDGDLVVAAMGRRVPAEVQLGVLAHADIGRLRSLGRYRRRGSVRRAWGAEVAGLAGELARLAGSSQGLLELQAEALIPLELDVLAGRRTVADRSDLIDAIRQRISAWADGGRPPFADDPTVAPRERSSPAEGGWS